MHGLQIWVALPRSLDQMELEFFHIGEEEIPVWEQEGVRYKLIAGEAFGRQSKVPVYSKLYMIEIKNQSPQQISIGEHLFGEAGLYILEGQIESDGNVYQPEQLLVAKESRLCQFTMAANSTIYIFGGEPFPEERFIDWNFVSSSKDLIREAREKWKAQQFDKVKGDENDFIPYPTLPIK